MRFVLASSSNGGVWTRVWDALRFVLVVKPNHPIHFLLRRVSVVKGTTEFLKLFCRRLLVEESFGLLEHVEALLASLRDSQTSTLGEIDQAHVEQVHDVGIERIVVNRADGFFDECSWLVGICVNLFEKLKDRFEGVEGDSSELGHRHLVRLGFTYMRLPTTESTIPMQEKARVAERERGCGRKPIGCRPARSAGDAPTHSRSRGLNQV